MLLMTKGKLSGLIRCGGKSFKNKRSFREGARAACDGYFPEESRQPTDLTGDIYRYHNGQSVRVNNTHLTLKEKLFGEYGPRVHVALAKYHEANGISYQGLTESELTFLKKVLVKMGMQILTDVCTARS